MNQFSNDYISDIIDEIALEGLDGITLEALWLRLNQRPRFMFKPNDDKVKKFLWTLISKFSNVSFYSLPVAREKLVIFNRLEHIDSIGNFYEPVYIPPCIYPHCPIEDKGIMGSCSTYKERQDITETVRNESYDTVISRGNTLVIVADQTTRSKALCSSDFNPLTELGVIQYCILERIGRSRYQGEVTQGKRGLQIVTDDPKMLYYFRKLLVKNKLVVKQLFYMKVNKQTSTGSLIHLPRFYTEIKTRQDADAEKLIEHLKNSPQNCVPIKTIKSSLNIELKKLLIKYPNNFKTMNIPFRVLNPTCNPNDWKMKSTGEEKTLRVVKLVSSSLAKEEDEEEDDEEEIGLMDESQRRLDRCLIRQAYSMVEQSGPRGIKQSTLGNLLAVPSLQARSICKHLVKQKVVNTVLVDVGRQRISHFYCTKFESSEDAPSNEVQDEKTKLLQAINVNTELCDESSTNSIQKSICDQGTEMTHSSLCQEKETADIETSNSVIPSNDAEEMGNTTHKTVINNDIEAQIIIKSSGERLTGEVKHLDNFEAGNSLTARLLKRASLIVQAVNLHRVIQDYQKIQKMINEEEESDGSKQTIDRKTLQRLVNKLEADGLIRIIKVNLKGHGKEKNITFICHPSVSENHSEIQSAIEQAKMKLPILSSSHSKKYDLKKNQDATKRTKLSTLKHDIRAGRKYGFKPKFIRMRVLHIYMYYLIYGYDGSTNLDQSCKPDIIKKLNLDESILNEMSTVYRNEVDWKIFLPPLPSHAEYPEGWCLLSDVLLRLPLCLFVSIVNVSYDIPGLLEYVEHPLRKYFLVKSLPQEILHHLTIMRKYIFVVSEIVYRLAYIGLIQMGPQKLKEKDQVFVYLNRNATLYNTIPSDAGYNQISKNKTYERLTYHFSSLDDIESYWYDIWNFAMNTNLGVRNSMTGQAVVVESVNTKKELLSAVQPKTIDEAKACDVGYLPGDHLGAAGLDSDMFVHLKRNWYWTGEKHEDSLQRSMLYPPAMKEQIFHKTLRKKKTQEVSSSQPQPSVSATEKSKKTKVPDLSYFKLANTGRKSKAISKKRTRILKQRKSKYARKPYYDQIDKDALSRMVKLRVDWSPVEDNLLLICKVASLYLSPDNKRIVARNFCAVREILHSTYPSSRNKTSRACQRRIRYMMKNPSTSHSVYLCLEEIKQDPEINVRFHKAIEKLDASLKSKGQGPKGYQAEYDNIFINLVTTLLRKLKTINNSDETNFDVSLPDTVKAFHDKYEVVVPHIFELRYGTFQEVQKPIDIPASVINSVIHSSLSCTTEKTNYAHQLFYIYQQYPDRLLRSVMAKCRGMSVVSCRRRYKRWKTAGNDCLPLASSPYQLSITYVHILQTKYQYNIFSECYNGLKMVLNKFSEIGPKDESSNIHKKIMMNIEVNSGGECANIVELFSAGLIEMSVEFPDQLIVLDPRLSETEESYKLIMKRFREVLSIIKDSRKKEKKSSLSDDESDDDEDVGEPILKDNSDPNGEQFNLKNKIGVANTASRLALYLMRDEPLEHLDQSIQHAHDYFVLNPCKVTALIGKEEVENTIFFKENKAKIISEIKRCATFPGFEVENDAIIDHFKTNFPEELIVSVLKYLESKFEFGATCNDIKENFDNASDVMELLSALVNEQFVLRTGVVNMRYVYFKYSKPWLVHSFFLPRNAREFMDTCNTNSSFAISFANHESVEKKKQKQKSNTTGSGLAKSLKNSGNEPPLKKMRTDYVESNVSLSNQGEKTNYSLPATNEENQDVSSDVTPMESISNTNDSPCTNSTKKDTITTNEGMEACSDAMDVSTESQTLPPEADHSFDDPHVTPESSKNELEPVKERSRFLMKATKRKWVALPNENFNKFANFDASDAKQVNILLRPWIKVDGTLNRRVLDRLLGSVLGHCLTSPGISLQRLQEKLTPALQPFHTFELVEILQKIGCLNLITVRKSWKCSLTSSRSSISVEPATSLESPAEVLIDTDPLAVSKMGYFIGDKNYTIDYLDALTDSKMY